MKNNNKIIINCTTEQKEKIQTKADKLGLTIGKYALLILLRTEIESFKFK